MTSCPCQRSPLHRVHSPAQCPHSRSPTRSSQHNQGQPAGLQVLRETALGAWLQQTPRLALLQLADSWVAHPTGNGGPPQLEGLVPNSGLPASLRELRLFPWPKPPAAQDGTGVEHYLHLLEFPRLHAITLWPAPGRLATSDFKILQAPPTLWHIELPDHPPPPPAACADPLLRSEIRGIVKTICLLRNTTEAVSCEVKLRGCVGPAALPGALSGICAAKAKGSRAELRVLMILMPGFVPITDLLFSQHS